MQWQSALHIATEWQAEWKGLEPEMETIICGSIRRQEEMVRDIDVLLIDPTRHGKLDNDVRYHGVMLNLYFCKEECRGAGMLFLTGCASHNIQLRARAKGMGMKLNRYGLWRGEECIASDAESAIFAALDLGYKHPNERRSPKEGDKPIGVHSNTTDHKHYDVYIVDVHGFNFCTCKGYRYRQHCRHLAEAAELV